MLVMERLELSRRGFVRASQVIAADCWRIRGAIEQLEKGETPILL
jgi:hypothetical protein